MKQKMTMAIIGCGRFAQFFVPLFKAHPSVEKVYVCDLRRERAEDFAKRFDVEIVDSFERATGVKLNWKYGPRREGDIEKIWGNVDKANKILGWKAEANLDDVLATAWKWQVKLREDGIM